MNSPQSRLAMLVIVWLAAGAISVAAQSVNVAPGQSGPVGSQGMSPPVSGNFGVTPQPGTAMTPGYAPGTAAPSVGSGAGPGLSSGAPFSGTGYGTSALGRTSPDAGGTLPSVPLIAIVCGSRRSRDQGEERQIAPQWGPARARVRRDQVWERRLRRGQWRREWGPAADDSGLRCLLVFCVWVQDTELSGDTSVKDPHVHPLRRSNKRSASSSVTMNSTSTVRLPANSKKWSSCSTWCRPNPAMARNAEPPRTPICWPLPATIPKEEYRDGGLVHEHTPAEMNLPSCSSFHGRSPSCIYAGAASCRCCRCASFALHGLLALTTNHLIVRMPNR